MFAATALCVASLTLLSAPQEAGGRDAPAPLARGEYEICFHHTLRNRTARELKDVRVYLPVPSSDAYQHIADYRIERDVPVHITNRTDGFGNKLKRVTIASIAAGDARRASASRAPSRLATRRACRSGVPIRSASSCSRRRAPCTPATTRSSASRRR